MNNYYKYKKWAVILAIISMILALFKNYVPVFAADDGGAFAGAYTIDVNEFDSNIGCLGFSQSTSGFFMQSRVNPNSGNSNSKFISDVSLTSPNSGYSNIDNAITNAGFDLNNKNVYYVQFQESGFLYGYVLVLPNQYRYLLVNNRYFGINVMTNAPNTDGFQTLYYGINLRNPDYIQYASFFYNYDLNFNTENGFNRFYISSGVRTDQLSFYRTNLPYMSVNYTVDGDKITDYIQTGNTSNIPNGNFLPPAKIDAYKFDSFNCSLVPAGEGLKFSASYTYSNNEMELVPDLFDINTNITLVFRIKMRNGLITEKRISSNNNFTNLSEYRNGFELDLKDLSFSQGTPENLIQLFTLSGAAGYDEIKELLAAAFGGDNTNTTDVLSVQGTLYATCILRRATLTTGEIRQFSFDSDYNKTDLSPIITTQGEGDDKTVTDIVSPDGLDNIVVNPDGTTSNPTDTPQIPEVVNPDLEYKDLIFNLKDVVEGANKDVLSFHKTFLGIIPEKFWGLIYYFVAVSVILLTVTIIAKALKGVIS